MEEQACLRIRCSKHDNYVLRHSVISITPNPRLEIPVEGPPWDHAKMTPPLEIKALLIKAMHFLAVLYSDIRKLRPPYDTD